MAKKYSYKSPSGVLSAKAQVTDADASFKDLCEVCQSIRGRNAGVALTYLELASKGERAVYFASHNKKKGHRSELNGRKGGYPKKSAKIVYAVLRNAIANATKQGITEPIIKCVTANKMNTYPRIAAKGRRFRADYETARVEIVVEEKQSIAAQKKIDTSKKKDAAAKAIIGSAKKEAKKQETPKQEIKQEVPKQEEKTETKQ